MKILEKKKPKRNSAANNAEKTKEVQKTDAEKKAEKTKKNPRQKAKEEEEKKRRDEGSDETGQDRNGRPASRAGTRDRRQRRSVQAPRWTPTGG